MEKRQAYIISDGTGITAETLSNALLTQFPQIDFELTTMPYVNSIERAHEVTSQINQSDGKHRAIIFATLVDQSIRQVIAKADALFIDFLATFIDPLESELSVSSSYSVGHSHSAKNKRSYNHRIDAVNFALNNDDGVGVHNYDRADIVLIGVSRCGKTPTSLYLALQFGIYVANYPFTEENIFQGQLPKELAPYKNKLFGMTIDPERLQQIRTERRPDSKYASFRQCSQEIQALTNLYQQKKIPYLNTTTLSIEEISTKVLAKLNLRRHLF